MRGYILTTDQWRTGSKRAGPDLAAGNQDTKSDCLRLAEPRRGYILTTDQSNTSSVVRRGAGPVVNTSGGDFPVAELNEGLIATRGALRHSRRWRTGGPAARQRTCV
eukprot:711386-Pyramimonas_sp.AAC.1